MKIDSSDVPKITLEFNEKTNTYAAMLLFMPPEQKAKEIASETVFVIDRSGSMSGRLRKVDFPEG